MAASLKMYMIISLSLYMTRGIWTDQEYVEGECYLFTISRKGMVDMLNQYDNDDLEENEYWEAID